MPLLEWQKRQLHADDVNQVLHEKNALDSKNRIRRWNGKEIWKELHEWGHDSLSFETCLCKNRTYENYFDIHPIEPQIDKRNCL